MDHNKNFWNWLKKYNFTEEDIIHCRKMQSVNIMENENVYGISSVNVCGFLNNDVLKLGGEIKQQYSEDKRSYYERCYGIYEICAKLMDSVNEVLGDEGSWGKDYFAHKFVEWRDKSIEKLDKK